MPLSVQVEPLGKGASVISLIGELDLSTIPRMEARLLEEVREQAGVVLDLTRLTFIDSSGIGTLIGAFHAATNGKRILTVVARGSQVDRVLRLVGLDRVLPIFEDRADALEALGRP